MALFLLITYIVILIFQIILFVISIRKKTKKLWRILFSAELVPLLISIGPVQKSIRKISSGISEKS